jgi:uncharacterized delta-60 repeat protein
MVSQAANAIGESPHVALDLTQAPGRPRRTSGPSSIRPRLEALEDRCLLSGAGSLDPSFGGTGIVTTSFPRCTLQIPYAVLIQPWDGKIIAAGTAYQSQANMAVARYNPDGSLDTGFGSGGKATAQGADAENGAAALYPHDGTANDGKIVVSGGQVVDRFNADGSPDKSFGKGGKVTPPTILRTASNSRL